MLQDGFACGSRTCGPGVEIGQAFAGDQRLGVKQGSQVLEQGDLIIGGCEPLDASHFSKPDLQSQPTFPSEVPIDAAAVSLNAAHKLADAVFENGLPRHKPETQSIFDHGKASAGKRGNTGEAATDIFASFTGREGQASLGSHFATDAIHLPLLQICERYGAEFGPRPL